MRVGFVVAADRYTGAAAVAEHSCRALLEVGTEARLLFRSGSNLEDRLRGRPWAVAGLVKERSPFRAAANLRAVRILGESVDAVICHLPHDHVLCVVAGVHRRRLLIRNFRNPAHLRGDPWHRWLSRRTGGALLANRSLEGPFSRHLARAAGTVVPVPLEDRFSPQGNSSTWRRRLGIPIDAPVLGMVGKLAAGRGFDLLLHAASRCVRPAQVLVVGHGEEQSTLESLAARLGIGDRVHWAGYQERELPELYLAMDVLLYAGAGSDHGHRTVSEAQGCGCPVVAAAVPGVEDLITDGVDGLIVEADATALAGAASALLCDPGRAAAVGTAATRAVATRRFEPAGHQLVGFLREVIDEKRHESGS